jgi:cell fate regulator YaaT (PSP1 superfamily)
MCCLKYENDIYNEMRRGLPDTGERVKTPDGLAKVVDTSVLEGKVKVRLYVEDEKAGSEGEDKLSTDIYTYNKEEIRRIEKRGKKRQEDLFQGVNAEELKELEKLIQD